MPAASGTSLQAMHLSPEMKTWLQLEPLMRDGAMSEEVSSTGCPGPFRIDHEAGAIAYMCAAMGRAWKMFAALIDGAETSLKFPILYLCIGQEWSSCAGAAHSRAAAWGFRHLMVDSFSSIDVNRAFFDLLVRAGGEIGWFGASWSTCFLIRNHQKMAIADDQRVVIGGFNVSDAYFGKTEDNCWRHGASARGAGGRDADALVCAALAMGVWHAPEFQAFAGDGDGMA